MELKTCVMPEGRFLFALHRPRFVADNFRLSDPLCAIGRRWDGSTVDNRVNLPDGPVVEESADWIYEIANPFPFKGATYIARSWAEKKAQDPSAIRLPPATPVSYCRELRRRLRSGGQSAPAIGEFFDALPGPLKIALATSSTDPEDLERLADGCAQFVRDPLSGRPTGLEFETDRSGRLRPRTGDHPLFEAVANNVYLPDDYKRAMLLRPGVQGGSEIVGEIGAAAADTHVFEYLRRNSYIPWGHYAANLADDTVRYRIGDLSAADVDAMRHLYYQRTYARLAVMLGVHLPAERRPLTHRELESLRQQIVQRLMNSGDAPDLDFNASLWGWNFGFDFSPSAYRLNASHQQIHQQFALVPREVPADGDSRPSFAVGDLVADFAAEYRRRTGKAFFDAYLAAIRSNRRMDGRSDRDANLTIWRNEEVLLFVPKAQTSQWEIQLICRQPVGNVLEADTRTRRFLDMGIRMAVTLLCRLGARMITTFEIGKRFDNRDTDQRLIYVFLPRIPQSPGGFSENQLRWIAGHYPEDFAAACRCAMETGRKDRNE